MLLRILELKQIYGLKVGEPCDYVPSLVGETYFISETIEALQGIQVLLTVSFAHVPFRYLTLVDGYSRPA